MKNIYDNIMKAAYKSTLFSLIVLTGCANMIPGLEKAIDDYVKHDAITVIISEEAIQNESNINVLVDIANKAPVTGRIK